jgi:8-oxo-dGTP diphosphatase
MIKISTKVIEDLHDLIQTEKSIAIDCLIINQDGKVFGQKRSSDRKKFPNCWDLPGGSLEKGETAIDCIQRELKEELDFELTEITKVTHVHEFELPIEMRKDDENYQFRIIQVVVKVKDYSNPVLEAGKVVGYEWFGKDNLDTLMEGREGKADTYIKDAVSRVLEM